MLVNDCHNSSY